MDDGGAIGGLSEDEIDRILEKADLNALRLALYQATRDPDLVAMQIDEVPFWGGSFEISVLAPACHAALREKAKAYIRGGLKVVAPSPDDAELRRMMEAYVAHPITDFAFELGKGDVDEEEFPLGVTWNREPDPSVKAKFHVAVIGAGFGGMATAIQLDRLGIPYTVIERNEGVGGTWWTNDYPQVRVDVASHHYQFSFMKKHPWKHWFSPGAELLDYANQVVDRYGLRSRIRLKTELEAARWDETGHRWEITLRRADGQTETLVANAIVSSVGAFSTPNTKPDIPGIDTYTGKIFHTTQWDHSYDFAGKRVGQIGAGSTGAQLMPEIAERCDHLTVYLRSPQWVTGIPGYRDAIPQEVQWLFDNFPYYWGWFNFGVFYANMGGAPEGLQRIDRDWQKQGGKISQRNDALRQYNIDYLMSKVGHNPDLVRKLMPDLPPFCKRPVVDNGWFDALNRPNVDLVVEPIERITPLGILTKDQVERPFDAIILGVGFTVEDYLWPVEYVGRTGRTLRDVWSKDGARAYLGVTVPEFPNFFMLYGPNAQARAGGLITWLELWSRYALKAIVKLIESGNTAIEVKADVYEDYNRKVDEGLADCVWGHGKTYYINRYGRQHMNMPWHPTEYYEWIKEPQLDDFHLS